MYFFMIILTLGFIYELSLGAIDLKMYLISRLDKKILYVFLFILKVLRLYIYGFLVKERGLIIYTSDIKLLHLLTIMKKNEIYRLIL
jgi:hypothetical protein